MKTTKFHYECIDCGNHYEPTQVRYLCPECSKSNSLHLPPKGVLKVVYNYSSLLEKGTNFDRLKEYRFLDLLPIEKTESLPKLKVGDTPCYEISELNHKKLPFHLFLKDDSQNPTYSFKDRASAVVSAFAKENGLDTIVAASTGNAGSSLAGICAAQGQKAIIIVPESAPIAKLTQIVMYGAKIIPVKGTYDDAFNLSVEATKAFGWYNRNTAFNPLTVEGKKTVAFEIFEQLGLIIPDRIFVPVGDGVILSGVYKGFEDLLELGIISHIPKIIAIQASQSDNLIRNISGGSFQSIPSQTFADSIAVDIPRNFYMAKDFLLKYEGESVAVSDDEILEASQLLSKNTGLFAEPAAAAAFAGMLAYQKNNKINDDSVNVVLLTGSGLKDLQSVKSKLSIPGAISPTLENLKKAAQ